MTQAREELSREFTSSCKRSQHLCRLLGTESGVDSPRCPGCSFPASCDAGDATIVSLELGHLVQFLVFHLCGTCPASPCGIEGSQAGLAFLGRHGEYNCTARGRSALHQEPCSGLPSH